MSGRLLSNTPQCGQVFPLPSHCAPMRSMQNSPREKGAAAEKGAGRFTAQPLGNSAGMVDAGDPICEELLPDLRIPSTTLFASCPCEFDNSPRSEMGAFPTVLLG